MASSLAAERGEAAGERPREFYEYVAERGRERMEPTCTIHIRTPPQREEKNMRHLIRTCALGIGLLGIASCTSEPVTEPAPITPAADAPGGVTEASILALEERWVAAIVAGDTATIGSLLADTFVGTSPNAHYFTRDMAVGDLASGAYTVTSMELDEASANVYGNTAVAFTSQDEVSRYLDEDTSGHYHYTNVWVRLDGNWQVVASHGSRYAVSH
jgi:hypothetical protein